MAAAQGKGEEKEKENKGVEPQERKNKKKKAKTFEICQERKTLRRFSEKLEMFLFHIGGTKVQMTEFLLLISTPFSLLKKYLFGSQRIFLSCFFVFLHSLSLYAWLVSTMLSGTWAPVQQILKHTCNIPAA